MSGFFSEISHGIKKARVKSAEHARKVQQKKTKQRTLAINKQHKKAAEVEKENRLLQAELAARDRDIKAKARREELKRNLKKKGGGSEFEKVGGKVLRFLEGKPSKKKATKKSSGKKKSGGSLGSIFGSL